MHTEAIAKHNRDHSLGQVNTYVFRAALPFGVVAIIASIAGCFAPPIVLPYAGALSLGVNTALIQVALLALLINTNNFFEFYLYKIDDTFVGRLLSSALYISHLAAAIYTLKYPDHWLVWVSGIAAIIVTKNLQLRSHQRTQPAHPFTAIQKRWLKRSLRHLLSIAAYAAFAVIVTARPFFLLWHQRDFTDEEWRLASLFVNDVRTLLYGFATARLCMYALRRVRLEEDFSREEINRFDDDLNNYHASRIRRQKAKQGA